MDTPFPRRDFLKTAPAALGAMALAGRLPFATDATHAAPAAATIRLEPFDYQHVRLLDSHWRTQMQAARDYYMSLTDDDILCGFRKAAGLPAPGTPLGGWCDTNSAPVFGQWLSGMARLSRATGDVALKAKAVHLLTEWGKTVKPDGDCGMRHYTWDKLVCGLVDMHVYAGQADALPLLERVTDFAAANYARDNAPATRNGFQGRPSEWYTLAENLYRAYQATGNEKYKTFAAEWLYPSYWNKFADTLSPADAHGVHAYSHVNTFSSAAIHHEITGDPASLRIIQNAYEYLQNTQCYATGGFGPDERLLTPDGGIGDALDNRPNTFETVCGSWAGFKLSRYLMRFTGEARYGDWAERLFYNGVGAALGLAGRGKNFYYSDYRSSGGMKVFRYDPFTCCSGTYIQCLADYHNLIYYKDASSLYVNLYVPSEVTWTHAGVDVHVVQNTKYPIGETTTLTLTMPKTLEFPLRFRVPQWSKDVALSINGQPANVECTPGTWATVSRMWKSGDTVEMKIPLAFAWRRVDAKHPDRKVIVRGPVVMAVEFRYFEPGFVPPATDAALNEWLSPDTATEVIHTLPSGPGVWVARGTNGRPLQAKVRPFYQFAENYPYLMYVDTRAWPQRIW